MTTLSPSHPSEPLSKGFTPVPAMPQVLEDLGWHGDLDQSARARSSQRVLFVVATGLLAVATALAVVGMLFVGW